MIKQDVGDGGKGRQHYIICTKVIYFMAYTHNNKSILFKGHTGI